MDGICIEALSFAATKHTTQRRKDINKTPYIEHPIEVALILRQVGINDANCIAAAFLHDTVEDTDATADEIQQKFGSEVARMVLEVSDDKTLSKDDRKRLQVTHAAYISHGAKLIKMADKLSNFRSSIRAPPQGWSNARITGYFVWGLAVVDGCKILDGHFVESYAKLNALFDEFRKLVPTSGTPESDAALELYYASMKDASE